MVAIFLALAAAAVLAIMLGTIASPGYVNASNSNTNTNTTTSTTLTPNQLAAGGPLPGNLSRVEEEQECITADHS